MQHTGRTKNLVDSQIMYAIVRLEHRIFRLCGLVPRKNVSWVQGKGVSPTAFGERGKLRERHQLERVKNSKTKEDVKVSEYKRNLSPRRKVRKANPKFSFLATVRASAASRETFGCSHLQEAECSAVTARENRASHGQYEGTSHDVDENKGMGK